MTHRYLDSPRHDWPDITVHVPDLARALEALRPRDATLPFGSPALETIHGAVHPCAWPSGPYTRNHNYAPLRRKWTP